MASRSTAASVQQPAASSTSLTDRLNGEWHKTALLIFLAVVLAHWGEHLAQAYQVYVFGWPVPESRGVLGLWFPWLVTSETLHYGYAIVMLVGLWVFRRGFVGQAYTWWMIAFWIQFWHHLEHALLQGQAVAGQNLFGSPVPVSIVQLWIPRVELHLIYNSLVFVPMVIGMYRHMVPHQHERRIMQCNCAIQPRGAT